MKTYEINYPDENGNNVTERLTEEQILESYFPSWADAMVCRGKMQFISAEACIEDWVDCHHAVEVTSDITEPQTLVEEANLFLSWFQ